jgi:hypothetical protein
MDTEIKNSDISKELSIGTYDKIKTQLETSFEEKINDFFTKADPIVKNKLDEMIKCWQTNQDLPQSMSLRDLCQAFVDNLLIQSVKLPDNGGEGSKTKDIFDNTFNSFFVRTSILVAIAYGFFKLINKIAPVQPDILNIISNFIYLVAVIISLYTTFSNKKNQSKI